MSGHTPGMTPTELDRADYIQAHKGDAPPVRDVLTLLKDALTVFESEYTAADCAFCSGQGGWTEDDPPRMTPLRHSVDCFLLEIKAAIAQGGRPMTPRVAADRIADFLFRITSEYGRPIVLSIEDREEIAGYVMQVVADDYVNSPSDGYRMPKR